MQIDPNLIRSMMQARQQQGPGGGMNYLSQQMAQGSDGQLGGLAGRIGQALQQRAAMRQQAGGMPPGGMMPPQGMPPQGMPASGGAPMMPPGGPGMMPPQGGPMTAPGVINAKRPMLRQQAQGQPQPAPVAPPPERGGMGPAGY